VIGFGKAYLVEDMESKPKAPEVIMQHYAGQSYTFPEEIVNKKAEG